MKTKSILFAAFVAVSFASISCKEENINPSTIDYRSSEIIYINNAESKTLIDGHEAVIDEQTTPNQEVKSTAIPANNKPTNSTEKVNIMQIDSDEVK